MSLNLNKNPGYLYQLSRENLGLESLIKQSEGFKEKEQALYLYLTPSGSSSCINPFNNRRLKSILNEVEVVVFDSPIEETSSSEFDPTEFCNILKMNMEEESLLRINDALSERLEHNPIGKIQIDKLGCEESDKLSNLVAGKMLVLMLENYASEMKGSASGESKECSLEEPMGPKERIYQKAKFEGKVIEYIDERAFHEKNKKLLFDEGLLEGLICHGITDSEFVKEMSALNKNGAEAWNSGALPKSEPCEPMMNPKFEKFAGQLFATQIEDRFAVAGKINDYLSSNKKTLLVLEEDLEIVKHVTGYAKFLNPETADIKIKRLLEPTGYFWKIKKDEKTVGYLLGSIHLTPEYLLDLNSRIRKCFEKSARLAVEIDASAKELMKDAALRMQKWRKEHLTRFTPEQIENICLNLQKLFPEDSSQFDLTTEEGKGRFISLGVAKLKSKIYTEQGLFSGIDSQLIQQAKTANKPVEDLETLEQYAKQETTQQLLSDDPIKDCFLDALSAFSTKDGDVVEIFNFITEQFSLSSSEGLNAMFDAWVEGNLESLNDEERSTAQKMDMTQRNLNMALKIVNLVQQEGKTFSCVGAAHTAGEMSIQAFLKNFGYSTERVFI